MFIFRKNICTYSFEWYVFPTEITIQCYIKNLSLKCEALKISIEAKNTVEDTRIELKH